MDLGPTHHPELHSPTLAQLLQVEQVEMDLLGQRVEQQAEQRVEQQAG